MWHPRLDRSGSRRHAILDYLLLPVVVEVINSSMGIPFDAVVFSLCSSPAWGTLSKALEKSSNMTSVCPLLTVLLARSWMVRISCLTETPFPKTMLGIG